MSVTDLPLVVAYREALESALAQASATKAGEESHVVIDVFRGLREPETTAPNGPAHDLAVESVVRERFIELVSSSDIHQREFEQVWNLIDITNTLSDHDLSEPSLAFYLIEELLDSQTIDGCRVVFDYLESRREQMIRKNFKTKSLVILRCCNELLRRLSRAEETVFCGRVFIYLFQTFPLGDRSSVNLRGVFHTENVTIYDEETHKSDDAIQPMDIDVTGLQPTISGAQTPSSSTALDSETKTGRSTPSVKPTKTDAKEDTPPDLDALYPTFWSLQGLFSDPIKLFEAQSMQHFKDGMASTLACFRYVSKHSAPTTETLDVKRGTKRKHDESVADQNVSSLASKFNPKYLTSRDLFDLEIHDVAFRRHFLVQALIMLDFLLNLSPSAKSKLTGLTNRSVLYAYTLSEDDTKWAHGMRQNIAAYLQHSGIGTEGSLYFRMVDTVLSRDKNWARWKAENCPPISRPPIDPASFLAAQQSLKDASKIPRMIDPLGSQDFDFLARAESVEALRHPSRRQQFPTLAEYYKGIQGDELDLEMAMDEKEVGEIEERKAGKVWRALRGAGGRRFVLCEQIKNGENLAALVGGHNDHDQDDGEGEADRNDNEVETGKTAKVNGHQRGAGDDDDNNENDEEDLREENKRDADVAPDESHHSEAVAATDTEDGNQTRSRPVEYAAASEDHDMDGALTTTTTGGDTTSPAETMTAPIQSQRRDNPAARGIAIDIEGEGADPDAYADEDDDEYDDDGAVEEGEEAN